MTIKQTTNLTRAQAVKSGKKVISLLEKRKLKLTPALTKQLMIGTTDGLVFGQLFSKYYPLALKGDKRVLSFLNSLTNKKFNPNHSTRMFALYEMIHLGAERRIVFLPALVSAAKSSDEALAIHAMKNAQISKPQFSLPMFNAGVKSIHYNVRELAIRGLRVLAEEGDGRALKGLLYAVKNETGNNGAVASIGLHRLAEKGNRAAQVYVKRREQMYIGL